MFTKTLRQVIKKERTIIRDDHILLDASLDIRNALMQAIIDKYQGLIKSDSQLAVQAINGESILSKVIII